MPAARADAEIAPMTAGDENFPVGSWLLPRALRSHVAVFYNFARGADDIADSPDLPAAEKYARLDGFEAALHGDAADDPATAPALRMRESLAETGIASRHCYDLLDAFRQDIATRRYADWEALMAYCARSANPVGRYLLDLHGETTELYTVSDPLCSALQVINHLQDAQDDLRRLDRVYVPQDWFAAAGIDARALDADRSSPALRGVLDRCLDGVDALLAQTAPLPTALRHRRLALESAAILSVAQDLAAALRVRDPLAGRVVQSRAAFVAHAARGILGTLIRRTVSRGPSSHAATPHP